MFYSKS